MPDPWPTAATWLTLQRAAWPKILREAVLDGNIYRQRYAVWMIQEILREEPEESVGEGQGRLL